MKRTDTITKLTGALLFLALLCYLGAYIWQAVRNPLQTADAVETVIRESSATTGLIVREEMLIESSRQYINITAGEGKRVAKGQAVAVSFGSVEALERANRVRELELEVERVEALLGSLSSAGDIASRDSAVRSTITSLAKSIIRHDFSGLDENSLRLRSLVFDSGKGSVTDEDLRALKNELSGLQASSTADTIPIYSQESGIFSSVLDGYEDLTPASVLGSSAAQLRALLENHGNSSQSAVGKIVVSSFWRYAALMDDESAARLSPGDGVTLEFGRYLSDPVSARVESVGVPEDGECVVVFTCSEALSDSLALRQVSVEVVFREYSGIRVPKQALNTDDEGSFFVYTLTGPQAEAKSVEIVYETEDFCLVVPSGDSASLRAGNEIIVSANDLYDGKVLR